MNEEAFWGGWDVRIGHQYIFGSLLIEGSLHPTRLVWTHGAQPWSQGPVSSLSAVAATVNPLALIFGIFKP